MSSKTWQEPRKNLINMQKASSFWKKSLTSEHNKTLVYRFYEGLQDFWRTGNMSSLDAILDSHIVQHIAGFPSDTHGLDNLRRSLPEFRKAFPDLQLSIGDMIAEDDRVAVRASWRGTHKGNLMGIPPTNKQIKITEMHIYRLADGKIVERWGEWDVFGLMQQLGIISPPGQK